MHPIKENLKQIKHQIKAISKNDQQVNLLAVSKTKSVEKIEVAYHSGQRLFGENYVQEAIKKIDYFKTNHLEFYITWHLIGALQSNKCKLVANYFDWIQTIDRISIAKKLNEHRDKTRPPINILIQVNISDEATKSGIKADEVLTFANELQTFEHLKLRGLMTIPLATDNENIQKANFDKMFKLYKKLQTKHHQIDTLSMGMSDDMNLAIKTGSTMVRVGRAIFGDRDKM